MKLAIVVLCLAPALAFAGPWVDDAPGHGYLQLVYQRYQASDYFTGPGELDPNKLTPITPGSRRHIQIPIGTGFQTASYDSTYRAQDMTFYGEVSLGRGFGGVLSMPLFRDISQTVTGYPTTPQLSVHNIGDLTFGIKKQIARIRALKGFAFGPQLYLTTPTGRVSEAAKYPAALMTPNLPMPTGEGTFALEGRGSFGYSFYPIPLFVTADVGLRHRLDAATCHEKTSSYTAKYSDDVPWSVQVGGTWTPGKKGFHHITVIGQLTGLRSLENGDLPKFKESIFTQPCGQWNNVSYFNVGGTVQVFFLKQLGITYTVSHTISGINTGYGFTNSIGLAAAF